MVDRGPSGIVIGQEGGVKTTDGHHMSVLSLWLVLYTPRGSPFVKWTFLDFSWRMYEWKMKNPWKSCHPLFWVHRVYGIQNNHLDLTINEFLTIWKTIHHIKRYLQFSGFFNLTNLHISLATLLRFQKWVLTQLELN